MENTGFKIEFRIFHLHKIFYSAGRVKNRRKAQLRTSCESEKRKEKNEKSKCVVVDKNPQDY